MTRETQETRIAPLEPPFDAEMKANLAKWMGPDSVLPPLALFRTLVRHPLLRDRMRPLGSGLLVKGDLPARVRELLILRTSARCGARYEWGVHVTVFAAAAGLSDDVVRATAVRPPAEVALQADEDSLILRVADELHDTGALSDTLFAAVAPRFGELALLEMAAVAGFYHLIAFLLGTARTPCEPWAAPFPIA